MEYLIIFMEIRKGEKICDNFLLFKYSKMLNVF